MGVHWDMELYFWSTRQTRLDFLWGEEVEVDSSLEFSGRIRIATIIPSSAVLGVVEEEGVVPLLLVASVVDASVDMLLLLLLCFE